MWGEGGKNQLDVGVIFWALSIILSIDLASERFPWLDKFYFFGRDKL